MSTVSLSRFRYYVYFIDEAFKTFKAWIERCFGCAVKILKSDGGEEYVPLKGYLEDEGIEQIMAPSYSPNLNAMEERANRTIVESARSIVDCADLSSQFWAEAVVHAARVRNIFRCPQDPHISSYDFLSGQKPDVGYLRAFGS